MGSQIDRKHETGAPRVNGGAGAENGGARGAGAFLGSGPRGVRSGGPPGGEDAVVSGASPRFVDTRLSPLARSPRRDRRSELTAAQNTLLTRDFVAGCGAHEVSPEVDGEVLQALAAFLETLNPPLPTEQCLTSAGAAVFERIGCAGCHTPSLPAAGRRVHLYSDLLLHEMGPGLADRISQGTGTGGTRRCGDCPSAAGSFTMVAPRAPPTPSTPTAGRRRPQRAPSRIGRWRPERLARILELHPNAECTKWPRGSRLPRLGSRRRSPCPAASTCSPVAPEQEARAASRCRLYK